MRIIINKVSLEEDPKPANTTWLLGSASSSFKSKKLRSGEDQAAKLNCIKQGLQNVNLDEEVVLAAHKVDVNGNTALTSWDDGAMRSFITNEFSKKVGLIGQPVTFVVETDYGR